MNDQSIAQTNVHHIHVPPHPAPAPKESELQNNGASKKGTSSDWLDKAMARSTRRIDKDGPDAVAEEIERIAEKTVHEHPEDRQRATEAMMKAWLDHHGGTQNELRALVSDAFARVGQTPKQDKPKLRTATVAGLFALFEQEAELKELLGRNAMTLEVCYLRTPPWKIERGWSASLPMMESDITRARAWLETRHRLRTCDKELTAVIAAEADGRRFHPVRDFLEQLEWDGTPRLATWLSTYLGAVAEGETEEEREETERCYFSAVGTRFLISAVARAYKPGCKVDTMLILEGKQGARKSTALSILAKDWFSDMSIDIGNKDTYLVMRKAWIYEHAELDSITRKEATEVKAFLSRACDHFRAPYARESAEQPRSLVFAGSVNDSTYLRDPTGHRRFWIVPVSTIDLEALRRDVDQLWAEAVVLYKQGEQWWLTPDEEQAADVLRAPREVENPYVAPIQHHLQRMTLPKTAQGECYVTMNELTANVLRLKDLTKVTPVIQNQVTQALLQLGYVKAQRRLDNGSGERDRIRCFVRKAEEG